MTAPETVPVGDISVQRRMREDFGDIESLMSSIRQHGLLHPIVVDAENRLVAGGRRLAAVRNLGWQFVAVRRLGELSDRERQEVELEENVRRKDLTDHERSKFLIELRDQGRMLAPEVSAHVGQKPQGGRPINPASDKQVSERIGIARATMQRADQHVQAVDDFPDLEPLPQSRAIADARARRAQENAAAVSIALPTPAIPSSSVRKTAPARDPDEAAALGKTFWGFASYPFPGVPKVRIGPFPVETAGEIARYQTVEYAIEVIAALFARMDGCSQTPPPTAMARSIARHVDRVFIAELIAELHHVADGMEK